MELVDQHRPKAFVEGTSHGRAATTIAQQVSGQDEQVVELEPPRSAAGDGVRADQLADRVGEDGEHGFACLGQCGLDLSVETAQLGGDLGLAARHSDPVVLQALVADRELRLAQGGDDRRFRLAAVELVGEIGHRAQVLGQPVFGRIEGAVGQGANRS